MRTIQNLETKRLFRGRYTNHIKIVTPAASLFRSRGFQLNMFSRGTLAYSMCELLINYTDYSIAVCVRTVSIMTNNDSLTELLAKLSKNAVVTKPKTTNLKLYLLAYPNSVIVDQVCFKYKLYLTTNFFKSPEADQFKEFIATYQQKVGFLRSSTILIEDAETLTACLLFLHSANIVSIETRISESQITDYYESVNNNQIIL